MRVCACRVIVQLIRGFTRVSLVEEQKMCDGDPFGSGHCDTGGGSHTNVPHTHGADTLETNTTGADSWFSTLLGAFLSFGYTVNSIYWNYVGYVVFIWLSIVGWHFVIVRVRTYYVLWTRLGQTVSAFSLADQRGSSVITQQPRRTTVVEEEDESHPSAPRTLRVVKS